jgi:hypothetical protein
MIEGRKILLINCSSPHYNLAIEKMKVYYGERAIEVLSVDHKLHQDADGVMFSCIFSWDVPFAVSEAKKALSRGKKVMIGGGGTFKLSAWIFQETGIRPVYKPVPELEKVEANFKAVYFTRGCNESCDFCSVWRIEGQKFVMNYKSRPARLLMDNNVSATPMDFKEHIVESYLRSGIDFLDCNSGFEPKSVDEETIKLFDQLPLKYWRMGFDEIGEEKQFVEAVKLIQSISKKKIRAYTMIGKEPQEQCHYRCQKVIDLGCEPVPQAFIPLDAKSKSPMILHDWNLTELKDVQRYYYSPQLWRTLKSYSNYKPRQKSALEKQFDLFE